MDNQNPTPNPIPPTENIPVQNPPVQETPPSQAYTAPQSPPPSSKSFLSNKIILLIVILLMLLGLGETFLALNSQPKPQPVVSKIAPTSAPTPTPNPTANWKTYTNTKHRFSFSYPQNLRSREEDHDYLGMQIYLEEDKKSTPSSTQAVLIVYNKQLGKTIDQDFDELYQLPTSASKTITNSVVGNIKLTKVGNRVVNGKKAFDYIRNSLPINPRNPEVGVGTYIDTENYTVLELIGNYIIIIESSEENRFLLDQILSTFRFD